MRLVVRRVLGRVSSLDVRVCYLLCCQKLTSGTVNANSSVTIHNIVGTGKPQWVSFYYHNPDGLCTHTISPVPFRPLTFPSVGDNRGVSRRSFILSRFASVSVNGGAQ